MDTKRLKELANIISNSVAADIFYDYTDWETLEDWDHYQEPILALQAAAEELQQMVGEL